MTRALAKILIFVGGVILALGMMLLGHSENA